MCPPSGNIQALETMLENFDVLYDQMKAKLYADLQNTQDLSERKFLLDEFFGRIEKESNKIKNS